MKKYLLLFRIEFSDLSLFFLHFSVLTVILLCILGYFGSNYGRQYEIYQSNELLIQASLSENMPDSAFREIEEIEGVNRFVLSSPLNTTDETLEHYSITALSNDYPFTNDLRGRSFTREENDSQQPLIIVPQSFRLINDLQLSDTLSLEGSEYEVIGSIGLSFYEDSFIVPRSYFLSQYTDDALLVVLTEQAIDETVYSNVIRSVSEAVGTDVSYSDFDRESRGYLDQFRLYAIVLFLAAVINVIYIYQYILETRRKQLSIYRLSGATQTFTNLLVAADSIVVFTLSFFIAYVLLVGLNDAVLEHLFPQMPFMLSLRDMALFYFSMLMVYESVLAVSIIRSKNHSIMQRFKKEGR